MGAAEGGPGHEIAVYDLAIGGSSSAAAVATRQKEWCWRADSCVARC